MVFKSLFVRSTNERRLFESVAAAPDFREKLKNKIKSKMEAKMEESNIDDNIKVLLICRVSYLNQHL